MHGEVQQRQESDLDREQILVDMGGQINGARSPTYKQLDLRVEKTWGVRARDIKLYLDVFNVTNRRNPLLPGYSHSYTEFVTIAWIPIVPSLGLEVSF